MDYDWLPTSDSQFLLWFEKFRKGCETYSGALDLSAEDLAEITADYKAFAYALHQIEALREAVQARIDFKNLLRDGPETTTPVPYPAAIILPERPDVAVPAGIVPRLIRRVALMKESKGYTVGIGEEIGIEALSVERIPTAPEHISPVVDHGMVRLDFTTSVWQGVLVESQRADEVAWTLLGTVFFSPFVDARPPLLPGLAEARRYRMRYVDASDAVGGYSQVVQVIVPADAAIEQAPNSASVR